MAVNPRRVWGGLLAACTAYEMYGIFGAAEGDTFSEVTRELWQVHSPAGKAAFTVGWVTFSAWYWLHITDPDRVPGLHKRSPRQ